MININITELAREYMLKIIKEQSGIGISVEAVKGGCSGMQFKFGLEKQLLNCDKVPIDCNLFFFIKPSALLFVIGSTLDYKKTMTGSILIFEKANFKRRCSCEKSFS